MIFESWFAFVVKLQTVTRTALFHIFNDIETTDIRKTQFAYKMFDLKKKLVMPPGSTSPKFVAKVLKLYYVTD